MDELPKFNDLLVLRWSTDNELNGFILKSEVRAIYMDPESDTGYVIAMADGKHLKFSFFPASEIENEVMRLVSDMGWN